MLRQKKKKNKSHVSIVSLLANIFPFLHASQVSEILFSFRIRARSRSDKRRGTNASNEYFYIRGSYSICLYEISRVRNSRSKLTLVGIARPRASAMLGVYMYIYPPNCLVLEAKCRAPTETKSSFRCALARTCAWLLFLFFFSGILLHAESSKSAPTSSSLQAITVARNKSL